MSDHMATWPHDHMTKSKLHLEVSPADRTDLCPLLPLPGEPHQTLLQTHQQLHEVLGAESLNSSMNIK